ncbi:MAG: xylulose kinase, partial [Actinomycetales bacterium]|nr:xylulose kinase [Actinomycetales bacterium]
GVALPHDWLTWRLAGATGLDTLVTDRSDASGTGYWSPTGEYRRDLLELALGRGDVALPRVVGPGESAGTTADGALDGVPGGILLGPGAGDNAAAALGLGMRPGDVALSIGTSGVVSAVTPRPTADASGLVNGFADATGAFLALGVTLNASRILDAVRGLLGVDHAELSRLALAASPGAEGLALVPFFEGERTPNRPDATAALHGMTLGSTTRENLARAAVEGLLCSLADGLDALREHGVEAQRVFLIGGGAQSEAVRRIAPAVLGTDVLVPPAGEYVADGAARQAAWVLSGADTPPDWGTQGTEVFSAEPTPHVRERYAQVRELTAPRI